MKRTNCLMRELAIMVNIGLWFCFLSNGLAADINSEEKASRHDEITKIEDVVVRGEVVNKNLAATSATVLNNAQISERIYITPLDIVSLSPGIVIYQYKQGGIFSPKAGLILSVLDNRLDIFANYGEGFALLPGFSEQAAFKQDHWDPQERTQYEAGIRTRPTDWFTGEVIAYRLETTKDFVYDAVADEYDNIGETTRDGIEAQVEFYAFDHAYFRSDYAFVDAKYDEYEVDGTDYSGKTLRGVPENIYNFEIGYNPPSGLGGRLGYHYEDGYYLDDANLYTSDGWDRVDAQLSYRFGNKVQYLAALDIVNLLDKKYADYTSGTTNKTYSPGLPLSIYVTFKMDF